MDSERENLVFAWRAFAGQRDPARPPSEVAARIAFGFEVREREPALRDTPLRRILEMIVAEDQMRRTLREMRPDLTRQRVGQMVNSWTGESWTGLAPNGEKYWLVNSLDHRQQSQRVEATLAHRAAGALGGRPLAVGLSSSQ